MGLILLICLYIVLGFIFSWVAAVVAKEDVEVKTGVLILVITGVCSLIFRFGVVAAAPELRLASPLVDFLLLMSMTHLIAKLSWKHSAIIAVVYSVLIFVLVFGLTACMKAVANSA